MTGWEIVLLVPVSIFIDICNSAEHYTEYLGGGVGVCPFRSPFLSPPLLSGGLGEVTSELGMLPPAYQLLTVYRTFPPTPDSEGFEISHLSA